MVPVISLLMGIGSFPVSGLSFPQLSSNYAPALCTTCAEKILGSMAYDLIDCI